MATTDEFEVEFGRRRAQNAGARAGLPVRVGAVARSVAGVGARSAGKLPLAGHPAHPGSNSNSNSKRRVPMMTPNASTLRSVALV
jgi:hypothetical protein